MRSILHQSIGLSDLSVDPTKFIVQADQPPTMQNADKRYPACLLFLLSRFCKKMINTFTTNAGIDSGAADVYGVVVVTIFSVPDFRWNGISLIDIFWAKYHRVCPPLFGISGSETTAAGKARLGWWQDDSGFFDQADHYQRMTGLASGFAALTLRDFSKSKNPNPAPNRLWWESMARILNLRQGEVQATHCVIVEAMISDQVPRIMQIFASAGKAALRKATVEFPEKAPKAPSGRPIDVAQKLKNLRDRMQKEHGLVL